MHTLTPVVHMLALKPDRGAGRFLEVQSIRVTLSPLTCLSSPLSMAILLLFSTSSLLLQLLLEGAQDLEFTWLCCWDVWPYKSLL